MKHTTLNLRGELILLDTPLVMGIINATPDSFYSESRVHDEVALRKRIEQIINEGGRIIDLGAYSTRPGAEDISLEEERRRLAPILSILRDEYPSIHVSVDTFRADIARWAVEEYGTAMINDISGGQIDARMFDTISNLGVPYILMHMRGTPQTMQQYTEYEDFEIDVLDYFIRLSNQLHDRGVHDVIIDPGFGFSKTLDQNYRLMGYLSRLKEALQLPILVGISRKSMIYRLLDSTPDESLTGTIALNTYALMNGADILRVHDVRQAIECVQIAQKLKASLPTAENPIHYISPTRSF